MLHADLLLSTIKKWLVSDVIVCACNLQSHSAKFEIWITRGDGEWHDAVGWHFQTGGRIKQCNLRSLIDSHVDRIDSWLRIGISFVVPNLDAIEFRKFVVLMTRFCSPIDREFFALFDFDRRARIKSGEIFGVSELKLGTLNWDVGCAADADRCPFPHVDRSAVLSARIKLHVFRVLITLLGNRRRWGRDDRDAVFRRTSVARNDVISKAL